MLWLLTGTGSLTERVPDMETLQYSATVTALLIGVTALIVGLSTNALMAYLDPETLRGDVFALNLLEYYVGVFCLLSAFYLQFSDRLTLRYMLAQRASCQSVAFFFVTGSYFALSSLRLFTQTRYTAVELASVGSLLMTGFVLTALLYTISAHADPEG
jgi:hypothetical protein